VIFSARPSRLGSSWGWRCSHIDNIAPFPVSPAPLQPAREPVRRALLFLFGLSNPVSRGPYAIAGFSLAALKYGVDMLFFYAWTGRFTNPLLYLYPSFALREPVDASDTVVFFVLLLWTVPFLWIGAALTLRRTLDARLTPWLAFVFFVPL